MSVPARVGGVDLSLGCLIDFPQVFSPRPCGRGGFKHNQVHRHFLCEQSPPVWAGWI